jgi:hypothetical protein
VQQPGTKTRFECLAGLAIILCLGAMSFGLDAAAEDDEGRWAAVDRAVAQRLDTRRAGLEAGSALTLLDTNYHLLTGSVVVTEQTKGPGACRIAMREFTLEWPEGSTGPRIRGERLMGQDCCDMTCRYTRSPGDWMVRFLRLRERERVAEVVHAKRGVMLKVMEFGGGPRGEAHPARERITRETASVLGNLEVDAFSCTALSSQAAEARCETDGRGEHYTFKWKWAGGRPWLTSISGTLEN